MRGFLQQLLCALQTRQLNLFQNRPTDDVAKSLFQASPRDGNLFGDPVNRNVTSVLLTDKPQRICDILIVDRDDIRRASRDDAEWFNDDLPSLPLASLHHGIEQGGCA